MAAPAEAAEVRVGPAAQRVTNAIREWSRHFLTGPHSEYMDQLENLLSQCARLLRLDRGARQAAAGLAVVAVFWVVGLLGGLHVILGGTTNAMAILVGLYLMLGLVILSLVVGAAATAELSRRATLRWRR